MRFGLNRVNITPGYKTPMAGWGVRLDTSDGMNDPLTFTSLIIENGRKRIFIGAIDLVGIDHEYSLNIRKKIAGIIKTDLASVMLNCSHTHTGMETRDRACKLRKEYDHIITRNKKLVENKILTSARAATRGMKPGQLYYGKGKTTLPLSRRLFKNGVLHFTPNPQGKTDPSLQILKITDHNNRIACVLVRVSCHPLALGPSHMISADYPGAFRQVFEKHYPESLAVFLQGAGGDTCPSPAGLNRKTWKWLPPSALPAIGEQLFQETLQVLTGNMTLLKKMDLKSAMKIAFLPAVKNKISLLELEQMVNKTRNNFYRAALQTILEETRKGKKLTYKLPVTLQAIRLGKGLLIAGVEAEILCSIGEKIEKKLLPENSMVLGYTNGSQCYIPDRKEYAKGGYEINNYSLFRLPYPLAPDMEDIVVNGIAALGKRLR